MNFIFIFFIVILIQANFSMILNSYTQKFEDGLDALTSTIKVNLNFQQMQTNQQTLIVDKEGTAQKTLETSQETNQVPTYHSFKNQISQDQNNLQKSENIFILSQKPMNLLSLKRVLAQQQQTYDSQALDSAQSSTNSSATENQGNTSSESFHISKQIWGALGVGVGFGLLLSIVIVFLKRYFIECFQFCKCCEKQISDEEKQAKKGSSLQNTIQQKIGSSMSFGSNDSSNGLKIENTTNVLPSETHRTKNSLPAPVIDGPPITVQ